MRHLVLHFHRSLDGHPVSSFCQRGARQPYRHFVDSAPHGAERTLKTVIRIEFLKPHDARARPCVHVSLTLALQSYRSGSREFGPSPLKVLKRSAEEALSATGRVSGSAVSETVPPLLRRIFRGSPERAWRMARVHAHTFPDENNTGAWGLRIGKTMAPGAMRHFRGYQFHSRGEAHFFICRKTRGREPAKAALMREKFTNAHLASTCCRLCLLNGTSRDSIHGLCRFQTFYLR